jgi:hypothetical protein
MVSGLPVHDPVGRLMVGVGLAVGAVAALTLAAGLGARRGAAGSMAAHIEETSRGRMQVIPGQSFSRAQLLTQNEAVRKLTSEFNALSNTRIDRLALASIKQALAPHKNLLWIDLLKVNDEKKGRGLGASAVDRVEGWAQTQGATAAVAVSYDYTRSGSPLLFWENRGYDVLHEDEEGAGGTGAAIIFKEIPHA